YGFGVIIFIPARIWDEFGETRTLWVWGGQNPSPPRPIAMPTPTTITPSHTKQQKHQKVPVISIPPKQMKDPNSPASKTHQNAEIRPK
ncbi:hypothetical protein L195_g056472, partial [Trifolium pratense]